MRLGIRREGDWFNTPLQRFTWTKVATKFADTAGPRLRDVLKEKAPRRPVWDHPERGAPGRLAESITHTRETTAGEGLRIRYEAHVPYASWVVNGTGPHGIDPVRALWLHWVDPRGSHWRRHTDHPGARSNDFPLRSLEEARDNILEDFRVAVRDSLRE